MVSTGTSAFVDVSTYQRIASFIWVEGFPCVAVSVTGFAAKLELCDSRWRDSFRLVSFVSFGGPEFSTDVWITKSIQIVSFISWCFRTCGCEALDIFSAWGGPFLLKRRGNSNEVTWNKAKGWVQKQSFPVLGLQGAKLCNFRRSVNIICIYIYITFDLAVLLRRSASHQVSSALMSVSFRHVRASAPTV